MSDADADATAAGATAQLPAAAETPASPPQVPNAPPRPRVFANFALDVLIATVLLIGYSTLFSLPVLIAAMFNLPADTAGAPNMDLVIAGAMAELAIAAIFAMLATAATLWFLRGRRLVDDRPPLKSLPAYTFAVLTGFAIQGFGLAISLLAARYEVALDPTNAAPLMELAQRMPWLAWLLVVLVAPFSEELLFRHGLLRRFMVAGRGVVGLVATALLFAYIHEPTPWLSEWGPWLLTTATYVVMGLGFGAVYLRTRRLGAAVVAHASCNLLGMLMLVFSSP